MKAHIVATLLVAASSMLAQQAPTKVGVINIQGAIVSTKEGQAAGKELQGRFDPRQKNLEAKQNEINAKTSELSKGATTLSEARKAQLDKEIKDLTKVFNRDTQDAQEEFDAERGKLVNEIGSKMMPILEKYGKDNSFALIFDVSSQDAPVLFAAAGVDLTQEIIDLYDKAHPEKSTGAASPASSPSASPTKPITSPIKPPASKPAAPSKP